MKVYVVVKASSGELFSVWSTHTLASEARATLEDILHRRFIIKAVEVDKINEWEVCYD